MVNLAFLFGVAASADAITPQKHFMMPSSLGTSDDLQNKHIYFFCNDTWYNATIFVSLTVALNDFKTFSEIFVVTS